MAGELEFPSFSFANGDIGEGVRFTESTFNQHNCIFYPEYNNEDITFAALIRVDSDRTEYRINVLSYNESTDNYSGFRITCNSLCDGKIHSVVITIESPRMYNYYIDGRRVGGVTIPQTYTFVGAIFIPNGAVINNIRFYDHILSAKEIDIVSRPLIFRQKLSRGSDPRTYTSPDFDLFGLTDISGFGHDLTINGAVTWQSDSPLSYGSVSFNGRGYFSTPNIGLSTPACTYTFWAKISSWSNMISLQSYPVLSYTDDLTEIKFVDGKMIVTLETEDSYCSTSYDVSALSDGWHFFSISYDTGLMCIKVDNDNSLEVRFDETSNLETGTGDMVIGMDLDGNRADGLSLYDMRIYAKKLSDDDLNDLYVARIGVDNKGNLYAHGIEPNETDIAFGSNGVIKADVVEAENGFRAYKDHIECTHFQEI